jgi:hypothetical protein
MHHRTVHHTVFPHRSRHQRAPGGGTVRGRALDLFLTPLIPHASGKRGNLNDGGLPSVPTLFSAPVLPHPCPNTESHQWGATGRRCDRSRSQLRQRHGTPFQRCRHGHSGHFVGNPESPSTIRRRVSWLRTAAFRQPYQNCLKCQQTGSMIDLVGAAACLSAGVPAQFPGG